MRETGDLLSRINVIWPVQSCLQKYSASPPPQIKITTSVISPFYKGRFAIVTDVRRDAVDAEGADDERRLRRTAKSCGPDASTPASNWRRQLHQ
jgi:hypothetical protein